MYFLSSGKFVLSLSILLFARTAYLLLVHERSSLIKVINNGIISTNNNTTSTTEIDGTTNTNDIIFTLHANGNGTSPGIELHTKDFTSSGGSNDTTNPIDQIIFKYCCTIVHHVSQDLCLPDSGARLFNSDGIRIMNMNQINHNHERIYCVYQGVHFVWPLIKVGHSFTPKNVESPIPGSDIIMTQISESPRAFSVSNFVTPQEIEELFRRNKDLMTPSEVGFGGWQDDTRTSSTSWDDETKAAQDIVERTFKILGVDYASDMFDPVQVLRYTSDGHHGHGQWYKPHVDWFDLEDYQNADPKINNGTNRFATMFLYLTDVMEGGGTVFPLSRTHLGYDNKSCVHDGTEDTAGYIDSKEARWCCNESSSALKTVPRQGNAVLFYGQGPDGTLDKYSLHGGCPPVRGEKWSANVWIWNRPHPSDEEKQKDLERYQKKIEIGETHVVFENSVDGVNVKLYYDADESQDGYALLPTLEELTKDWKEEQQREKSSNTDEDDDTSSTRFVFQFTIPSSSSRTITTYPTHAFIAVNEKTNQVIWAKRIKPFEDYESDDGAEKNLDGETILHIKDMLKQ
jgi:hypothetical protein